MIQFSTEFGMHAKSRKGKICTKNQAFLLSSRGIELEKEADDDDG